MEQRPQVQSQPLVRLRMHMLLVDKKSRSRMPRKALPSRLRRDGSYSIAVAKKNSAYAKSGTNYYGTSLNAAVRAMVAAYAKATRSYGLANSSASAWASSRGGSRNAKSSSWTKAFACVGSGCQKKIRLSRTVLKKKFWSGASGIRPAIFLHARYRHKHFKEVMRHSESNLGVGTTPAK